MHDNIDDVIVQSTFHPEMRIHRAMKEVFGAKPGDKFLQALQAI